MPSPEGFKNPHILERNRLLARIDNGDNKEHPFIDSLFLESTHKVVAFEAGADEYERCLEKNKVKNQDGTDVIVIHKEIGRCNLVFLPEKEGTDAD